MLENHWQVFSDIVLFIEGDVRGIRISDHRDVRHLFEFDCLEKLPTIRAWEFCFGYVLRNDLLVQVDCLCRYFGLLWQIGTNSSTHGDGGCDFDSNLPHGSHLDGNGQITFVIGASYAGRQNLWTSFSSVMHRHGLEEYLGARPGSQSRRNRSHHARKDQDHG